MVSTPTLIAAGLRQEMIRPFCIHHSELRGKLCRAAFEIVQEMMVAAAIGCEGVRTFIVYDEDSSRRDALA